MFNPTKQSLVIANSWKEVQEISKRIRSVYQAEGKVGNENVIVKCCVSGKQLDFEFSVGDRIKLCRNDYARNITNGALATITEIREINDGYLFSINTDDGRSLKINSRYYCDELGSTYISHAYALTVYLSMQRTDPH
jgi:ATP-dependent exoDNAse (exonuclease V) alpha subunit